MVTKIVKTLAVLSFAVVLNINSVGKDGGNQEANQLLIDSAATGNLDGVQEALKRGADINYNGKYRLDQNYLGPAILHSAKHKHLNIIKFLIEEKKVNTEELVFPLLAAIYSENLELIRYLLDKIPYEYLPQFNYGNISNLDILKLLIWNGVSCLTEKNEDLKSAIERFETWGIDTDELMFDRNIPIENLPKFELEFAEKINLLKKFALKVELKYKSYKDMVKRVNQYRFKSMREFLKILPEDLENLVIGYCVFIFPENLEEFFKISEEDLNELISEYTILQEIDSKKTKEVISNKKKPSQKRHLIM